MPLASLLIVARTTGGRFTALVAITITVLIPVPVAVTILIAVSTGLQAVTFTQQKRTFLRNHAITIPQPVAYSEKFCAVLLIQFATLLQTRAVLSLVCCVAWGRNKGLKVSAIAVKIANFILSSFPFWS